jgi:hypothetical protein
MPQHEYICPDKHISLITLSIYKDIPLSVSCEACKAEATYYWGNKKISGTVSGGTGGGRKLGRKGE